MLQEAPLTQTLSHQTEPLDTPGRITSERSADSPTASANSITIGSASSSPQTSNAPSELAPTMPNCEEPDIHKTVPAPAATRTLKTDRWRLDSTRRVRLLRTQNSRKLRQIPKRISLRCPDIRPGSITRPGFSLPRCRRFPFPCRPGCQQHERASDASPVGTSAEAP